MHLHKRMAPHVHVAGLVLHRHLQHSSYILFVQLKFKLDPFLTNILHAERMSKMCYASVIGEQDKMYLLYTCIRESV